MVVTKNSKKTKEYPPTIEDFILESEAVIWGTTEPDQLLAQVLRSYNTSPNTGSMFPQYKLFRDLCKLNGLDYSIEKYSLIALYVRREAVKELVRLLKGQSALTARMLETIQDTAKREIAWTQIAEAREHSSIDIDPDFHQALEMVIDNPELDLYSNPEVGR